MANRKSSKIVSVKSSAMESKDQASSVSSMKPSISFRFEDRDYRFFTAGEADLIHREFLQFGTFLEAPSLAAIRRRGLQGVYFDIGANLGGHSIFFANHCNATKVVAFEGNAEMAALWKQNIKVNAPESACRVEEHFVSVHPSLSFHRDPENSGGSHVEAQAEGGHRSVALGDFIVEQPVFIKIDVEGHELEVLRSGVELLKNCGPELCIEILAPEESGVFEFLHSLGYGCYGELSNANHYFIPDHGMLARTARLLEVSKMRLLRALGWRLRVFAAARLGLISWSDALSGVFLFKNARNAIRKAVVGEP